MVSKYVEFYSLGDKIGDWTVVSQPAGDKWVMRCGCGKVASVNIYNLIKGSSKSCYPCSAKKKFKEGNPFWKGKDGVPGKKWSRMVQGAESRGIVVEVDFDYIVSIFTETCALSGLPITKDTGSIDRIDSSKGYIEGNIQWVHKDINKAKNDLDEARFIELCKLAAERNK